MATLIDAFPLIKSLRDAVFLSATISEMEQLTPRMRRVRFSGSRLQGLNWTPGQHIRLQVAGLGESVLRLHPHDALRTYSIYDADPGLGTLDIVMLDHAGDQKSVTPARRFRCFVRRFRRCHPHPDSSAPQGLCLHCVSSRAKCCSGANHFEH